MTVLQHEALAGAIVTAVYGGVFLLGELLYRRVPSSPELSRKVAHVLSGVVASVFPWVFQSHWTVLGLAAGLAGIGLITQRAHLQMSAKGRHKRLALVGRVHGQHTLVSEGSDGRRCPSDARTDECITPKSLKRPFRAVAQVGVQAGLVRQTLTRKRQGLFPSPVHGELARRGCRSEVWEAGEHGRCFLKKDENPRHEVTR